MTANNLIPLLASACLLLAINADAGRTAKVSSQQASLRASPSHLANVITTIPFNAEVEVLGYIKRKPSWRKVRYGNSHGWLPASALQRGQSGINWHKLGSGKKVNTADQDTITLAGKGFSPVHEAGYKKNKNKLDYSAVDRMETFAVSAEELRRFAEEGNLNEDL